MALSNEALPIVLSLIDQLHKVRRDLRHLTEALEDQPPDMRAAVIAGMLRRSSQGHGMPEAAASPRNGTGGKEKP
jgi:chaperone modulatory protein CbpM